MASQPRRRRSLLGVFVILVVILLLGYGLLVAILAVAGETTRTHQVDQGDEIGVITVAGIISASASSSLLGGASGAGAQRLIDQIRDAADDAAVKAVVLRINSPGGTAAASQELFEAIYAARERKPFIASMADVAASGGYYIAAACDRIVALRATMTGSIGVMMPGYDLSGLLKWIKVEPNVIKSGKFKDIGSPERPMNAAERELLQSLVNNTYEQFLGDVAKGRKQKVEQLRPLADGRILTGEIAKQKGLVDDLGGFYEAVRIAERAAGLKPSKHPNLSYYGRQTLWEQLLEVKSVAPAPSAQGSLLGLTQPLSPLWLLAPVSLPVTVAGP